MKSLMSPELIGIAKAVGLTMFTSEAIHNLVLLKHVEDSVKKENYYFLWKARNLV